MTKPQEQLDRAALAVAIREVREGLEAAIAVLEGILDRGQREGTA
jgi:hypothetical protein